MIVPPGILAASDFGDMIWAIALLVFAAIGALSKYTAAERKKQADREAQERRRRENEAARTGQAMGDMPETQRPQPQQGVPQRVVRRTYRRTAASPSGAGQRGQQGPVFVAVEQQVRVQEELRRQQERLRREELQRQQRLAEYRPPESDDQALTERIVHVHPSIAVAGEGTEGGNRIGLRVNLSDPSVARTAIVFSEILGRPKALRESDEMWDV